MQLVAYGAQDVYLTGNPQITFFKVVYRRHTNFSMESIQQTFNGNPGFGQRVSCTVSRNGDLCHKVYLEVDLGQTETVTNGWQGYVNSIGHAIIKSVEVEIGGQRIDKQYGDWMEALDELSCPAGKELGRERLFGKYPNPSKDLNTGDTHDAVALGPMGHNDSSTDGPVKLYIPLQFWFCRNPGLALPLIALQYHEVKINVEFAKADECMISGKFTSVRTTEQNDGSGNSLDFSITKAPSMSASLWCDYMYLDTDERRRFAQVSHEYLIEQLQFTGDESLSDGDNKVRMNFNHPVKELVWCLQKSEATAMDYNGVTKSARILLNGHDRMAERKGEYFRDVQPFQHHTRIPEKNVYCYSFALKPEDHQPSGTCNFSRIDNATLSLDVDGACTGKLFAVNYNVLRIMSGMGGLAYSN